MKPWLISAAGVRLDMHDSINDECCVILQESTLTSSTVAGGVDDHVIHSLLWSAAGDRVVTLSESCRLRVWEVRAAIEEYSASVLTKAPVRGIESGKHMHQLIGHERYVGLRKLLTTGV